jgi:hypothetical protein
VAPDGTVYGIELLNANEQLEREDGGKILFINEATNEPSEFPFGRRGQVKTGSVRDHMEALFFEMGIKGKGRLDSRVTHHLETHAVNEAEPSSRRRNQGSYPEYPDKSQSPRCFSMIVLLRAHRNRQYRCGLLIRCSGDAHGP